MHELIIFGIAELQKRPLHRLLPRRFRNVYLLHRERVEPGIEHTGRDRPRRRIKILYLLRIYVMLLKIYRKLYSVAQSASRVARHKIRNEILLFAYFFVYSIELVRKLVKDLVFGLAHIF